MKTKLITRPTEGPVTASEVNAHLRVFHEDAQYMQAFILNATIAAENFMGRKIMPQTHALFLSEIPTEVELPFGDTQSIEEITYKDAGGVTQTLDPSKYSLNEISVLTFLERPIAKDVKITFTCGYLNAANVPAPIKHAILMLVETMYNARGDVEYDTKPIKNVFCSENLLQPYKIY